MDIMDPQWRSRKAERLSGSGHGRLNSYSPSRQTRVPPYAPVLCPLGASSRVHRRSHTRRHGHGIRPQKWPEMLIVCVLPDPDSPKTGIDAAAAEFSLSSSAAAGRGFLVFCASPFDFLLRSRPPRRSRHHFRRPPERLNCFRFSARSVLPFVSTLVLRRSLYPPGVLLPRNAFSEWSSLPSPPIRDFLSS